MTAAIIAALASLTPAKVVVAAQHFAAGLSDNKLAKETGSTAFTRMQFRLFNRIRDTSL
ncbi:hypothetical protein [Paraburkholderia youngii]|uniref:HTH luxR-type domain-containing protein n=1 Tax=Paraburkholderia youngii TaxID=2782701 RepID=A0A7W8P788_9BURK|nr:hypothetical protein [Paraburkholderia youngii]MBB5402617.1 hypothetical protein [Paraburkholderia youngii]